MVGDLDLEFELDDLLGDVSRGMDSVVLLVIVTRADKQVVVTEKKEICTACTNVRRRDESTQNRLPCNPI